MNTDKVKKLVKGYEESNIYSIKLARELNLDRFAIRLSEDTTKVHNGLFYAMAKNIREAGPDKKNVIQAINSAEDILKLLPNETSKEIQKKFEELKEAEKKASSKEETDQVWRVLEGFIAHHESILTEEQGTASKEKKILPEEINVKRQQAEVASPETSASSSGIAVNYTDSEKKPDTPPAENTYTISRDEHQEEQTKKEDSVEEFCDTVEEFIFSLSEISRLRKKSGAKAEESNRQIEQMMKNEIESMKKMLSEADKDIVGRLKINGVEKMDSAIDEVNDQLSRLRENKSLTSEEQEELSMVSYKLKNLNELRRFIDKY